jgi:hypothetical protein
MKQDDTSILHGDTSCPLYNEPVLPNEDGNCSLCAYAFDDSLQEIIANERKQAWQDGHDSAVHHIGLYGHSNLLTPGQRDIRSYPVLAVSMTDFTSRYEQYEGEDREAVKEEIALVETLTSEEHQLIAERMCDYLWDGDNWDSALDYALDTVQKYRNEATITTDIKVLR